MLVRRIKNRGANIVVEANAEILMLPTGDVGRWKKRLTERVKQETRKEAPTNKRPRWGHYGAPLRNTFTSSTSTRLTKGGGFIYSAIGSRSPHAFYVDQGTGIYNGGAPYAAKVLPPWTRGSPSLYEHTWSPTGPGGRRVKPVMIKGQKGQKFFDKGLDRAFRSVGDARYRAVGGSIGSVLRSFPEGLANFAGNTPADGAFKASLEEWRKWRDDAWDSKRTLGKDGGQPKREKAVKPPKAVQPPKPPKAAPVKPPKKPDKNAPLRDKQDAAVAAFRKQNPNIPVLGRINAGLVVKTTKGRYVIPWSRLYNLL